MLRTFLGLEAALTKPISVNEKFDDWSPAPALSYTPHGSIVDGFPPVMSGPIRCRKINKCFFAIVFFCSVVCGPNLCPPLALFLSLSLGDAKVVDDNTYFEIMPEWAKNITVGFARMEGHPVGIVANNPMFLAGCLDIDTSTKASQSIMIPRGCGNRVVLNDRRRVVVFVCHTSLHFTFVLAVCFA